MSLGLAALGIAFLPGCNQERKAPPAPKARSEAIQGAAVASSSPAPSPKPPAAHATAEPRRGKLCEGQMQKAPRAMPASDISRASAPGAAEPAPVLPLGGGKWTWVNFWAAWCVPCKEEIPRLFAWEKKLNQAGIPFRLVFVTLDDDERQLSEFLRGQATGGLQSTYWLKEGEEREKWLEEVGWDKDPKLPAHLLADPQGKLRCVIDGAVEDGDYGQLVALLRK